MTITAKPVPITTGSARKRPHTPVAGQQIITSAPLCCRPAITAAEPIATSVPSSAKNTHSSGRAKLAPRRWKTPKTTIAIPDGISAAFAS